MYYLLVILPFASHLPCCGNNLRLRILGFLVDSHDLLDNAPEPTMHYHVALWANDLQVRRIVVFRIAVNMIDVHSLVGFECAILTCVIVSLQYLQPGLFPSGGSHESVISISSPSQLVGKAQLLHWGHRLSRSRK